MPTNNIEIKILSIHQTFNDTAHRMAGDNDHTFGKTDLLEARIEQRNGHLLKTLFNTPPHLNKRISVLIASDAEATGLILWQGIITNGFSVQIRYVDKTQKKKTMVQEFKTADISVCNLKNDEVEWVLDLDPGDKYPVGACAIKVADPSVIHNLAIRTKL
jgi:hypothetical protein